MKHFDVKHLYKDEAKDEKSLATGSQDVVTEDVTTTEEVQDEEKRNKEHSKRKNGKKVKFKRDVESALEEQEDKSMETLTVQEDESAETEEEQKDEHTVTRVGRRVRRPKRYQ